MLNDIQNNQIATKITPIALDLEMLAMDETTISNEQQVIRPSGQKRRPILDARRRRHARLGGRH